MASSEEQLRKDVTFTETPKGKGVVAALEIKIYDNGPLYSIGNTPRIDRAEVLHDINQVLDMLETQSEQRRQS